MNKKKLVNSLTCPHLVFFEIISIQFHCNYNYTMSLKWILTWKCTMIINAWNKLAPKGMSNRCGTCEWNAINEPMRIRRKKTHFPDLTYVIPDRYLGSAPRSFFPLSRLSIFFSTHIFKFLCLFLSPCLISAYFLLFSQCLVEY